MAEPRIPDAIREMSADALHSYAHGLFRESRKKGGKAFAVAAAGAKYVGSADLNAAQLFEVIRGVFEDATVEYTLEDVIDQLAALAGSKLQQAGARRED